MKKAIWVVGALCAAGSSTRLATQAAPLHAQPVQFQATKLDLSSPEKSVRSFVAALNAQRFEQAARCVDGSVSGADFKPVRDSWMREKANISLPSLSVSTQGNHATVRVTAVLKSSGKPQTQMGTVALVRRGARWLLVPLRPQEADANTLSKVSLLSAIAQIVASPQAFLTAREAARRESCSSNLKQIALGAIMLSQDDKKLAFTPQNFKAKIFPYVKTMQIFRCPSVPTGESYSFNGNLANRDLNKIPNASRVVMFYEGKNERLDFRHQGTSEVAFADGHVKSVTRQEAKTLKWQP